jgi:integration host factor subunit alpha
MVKSDLTENLHERLGLSKTECEGIIDKFLKIVKRALADGQDVKLSGFGNFTVKEKKARPGRNPQTGEKMELPAKKVLTFKLSQVIKNELNGESGL